MHGRAIKLRASLCPEERRHPNLETKRCYPPTTYVQHPTEPPDNGTDIMFRSLLTTFLSILSRSSNFFKAQQVLNVPQGLTFKNSMFSPHSAFVCLVWISEQTAISSLCSISPLTPNDTLQGSTAPLTSKVAFYIFIQRI